MYKQELTWQQLFTQNDNTKLFLISCNLFTFIFLTLSRVAVVFSYNSHKYSLIDKRLNC